MTEGLLGQLGDLLDLSNPAWVHELRDPHTGEWIDSPTAAQFPHPEPGKPGTVGRYKVPDPRRLFTKTGYRNPADHPFWKAHPPSVQNILDFYDRADAGTREQGRAWYRQIHDLAGTYIAPGNPEAGGILLSNYSSQTSWPIDMMNAARSWQRGYGIGKGEGVIATDQQAAKANKAIAGEGIDKLMTTAKTHSFGLLIKQGDDSPDDPYGHVVIDTHAANLATGGHLRGELLNKAPINDARQHEYVADFYRQAAKIISEREGKLMKPHELQAITWLVQQHANQVYDDAVVAGKAGTQQEQRLSKGRRTMTKNAWKRWVSYAQGQGMKLKVGVSAPLPQMMTAELMAQQIIEMAGPDSLLAQLFDLTGDGHGHHVPGTPMVYRHGWEPVAGTTVGPEGIRLPGGRAPAPARAAASGGRAALDAAMASGVKGHHVPGAEDISGTQGVQGGAEVVDFGNGASYIHKDYKHAPQPREVQQLQVAKEVLAAKVSDALGAGAPEIIPVSKTGFYEPKIDGMTAMEYLSTGPNIDPLDRGADIDLVKAKAIAHSPSGARIGLMDTVIGSSDRHWGNVMVTPAGTMRPIDHNDAWGAIDGETGNLLTNSPMAAALENDIKAGRSPFTVAQIDEAAGKMRALEPEFAKLPFAAGPYYMDLTMDALKALRQKVAAAA